MSEDLTLSKFEYDDKHYPYSSVGCLPIILPQLFNIEEQFDTNHEEYVKNSLSSVLSFNQATSSPVKLQGVTISDKILIDAYEFMNAIYEDMS